MGSRVSLRDASRNRVDQNLAPLDIQVGRNCRILWQDPGHSRCKEVGGGEEGVTQDTGTSKDDQVPLGRPLSSGHLNIGMGGISGEHGIAGIDQNRGHKGCLGTESQYEHVMGEAQHKAGPRRGGCSVASALSKLSLGAKGGLRGARLGSRFCGSLGEGCLLPIPCLGDARSNPVPSVVAYRDTRWRKGRGGRE